MNKGETIKVLDKGFVTLIDVMGDDDRICEAARTSTGSSNKDNAGLIDYLMRHRHTSPFEFVEFVFHIKCPIYTMRQLIRHRTANVNEASGRYKQLPDEFHLPEVSDIRIQSKTNKQMSEGNADSIGSFNFTNNLSSFCEEAYSIYQEAIDAGIAREQARFILPVNLYTEFYWKMDLHNLLHFLRLRMDKHAQLEIRQFANAIAEFVKTNVPLTWKSFEDHTLNSITLSKTEINALFCSINLNLSTYEQKLLAEGLSKGRVGECMEKIKSVLT